MTNITPEEMRKFLREMRHSNPLNIPEINVINDKLSLIEAFISKHSDPDMVMVPRVPWQPIETAPKDGVTKALYGCYKDGKWYEQITKRGSGVGGLHVNVPTGFRSYTGATHWMPLPNPPTKVE